MIVKLLGYAPDADPTIIGAIVNCSAVVPTLRGFRGAPVPVSAGFATLAATCQGASSLRKLDDTTRIFAGTPTKLYEAGASTWSDVSRAAAYTAGSTQRWRFAQFNNVSLAVNGADTVQASVSSGAFSDVAGAPLASIIETVGAFVFAFNISGTPNGWQCAGINGYTSWAASVATQAASGTLFSTPGPITAGRKFGSQIIAYKKNSMYIGTYVGPPNIWQFNQIRGAIGAMSHEAVVNIGTTDNPEHIFMGEDNFYLFDGAKPIPIGTDRVKVAVFNSLLQSRYYACAALHDRTNSLVYFYYPVADSQNPDHCVVYNYRTDRWGVDDRQILFPFEFVTPGLTYTALGTIYNTYQDLPNLSYDLAFLSQALEQPAIFDSSGVLKTLTGAAGASSFTLGDLGDDARFNTLQRVRPRFFVAPIAATLKNYYRNNTGDALTTDANTAISSSNTFDVLRDARWHRLEFGLTGDWEAGSVSIEYAESGLE